jgi:hypothetical protein
VKKMLCFTALCAALAILCGSAMAQLSVRSLGTTVGPQVHSRPGAPPYCKPCLFYGGDWNNTDANWVLFADGNVPSFGSSPADIYSAFKVPAGKTWTVTGLFANVGFINTSVIDPSKPAWSIKKGIKAGIAGKVVAHGTTTGTVKATGRTANSGAGPVVEYTVAVKKLPKAVTLKAGTYYELVESPCTNTSDTACASALYFVSDTYDATGAHQGAHHFGPAEPKGLNFQNSTAFGLNYVQINGAYCTSQGYPQPYGCNWISDGVLGTQQ